MPEPDSPRVVLASGSPRRRELLASLGIEPIIRVPDVDETLRDGETPRGYVVRLACEKAAVVAAHADVTAGDLVFGADTTVVLDGAIIGKPTNRADAAAILRRLSGRTHQVHTGVAARLGGRVESTVVDTDVTFVSLSDDDIAWYVATGEPDDKAGAYGMQGTGTVIVASIDGSPSNVIGLPLPAVVELAARLGVRLLAL